MSRINVRNTVRIDLNLLLTFHCLMSERSSRAARDPGSGECGAASAARAFRRRAVIRCAPGMQPTRKAMELAPQIAEVLTAISGVLAAESEFSPHDSSYVFNIAL
ncbi:hypothetical protein [Pseudomonas aeruginosa]|uniref:hypothetical protein n=1 Tax=Pseudomonas aeruginosa TaxID=287 RepID=UPI003FD666C1